MVSRQREQLGLAIRDEDGVFIMGAEAAIPRDDRPAVAQRFDVVVARRDHRLDADRHALAQADAVTGYAEIRYARLLMHLAANAMAAQVADGGKPARLDVLLDGVADVADAVPLPRDLERGEEAPETFMQGIRDMVCELVKTYKTVLGADVLFPSGRTVVGKCPRCGSDVTESKKGYFCERNDCHFGLWRDNRFLAAKKINLPKKMAETLLKDGKTYASGIFSEKTGKTYDAYIVLEDDGQRSAYKLEFSKESRK